MFKRRATLDSTTQSRPNLPPPILPTQTPTVENSFSQNILKRIPSLHGTNSKSSRVKVPNSSNSSNDQFRPQAQAQPQQNISPSNSSINFARPSNDYSSHNNNNNGNYQQNYSNGNNNNNAAAVGGSSSYYNSLSRSTSTITTQSFQQAPPLHQHNQNSYTSNRNANQHRSSSQSIASLYPSSAYTTSPPPVPTIPSIPKSHSLPNIRKIHKLLTCYNLICIGSKSTGKTAFIKTLIRNLALVKSSHEKDALNRIEAFGNQKLLNSGAGKKSEIINLEIVTDAKEKINLSIVDTVGLDVQSGNSIGSIGHEMELERQLDALMRIIEDRFQDSLAAENETFRNASTKVQDSHIHLCLYFIHPSSITIRRSLNPSSPIPTPRNSSEQMPSPAHPSTIPASTETLSMSPLDLRNLRKLSRSCNVLPILARSDELTVLQFSEYKKLIKRELLKAGIRFNPFELNSSILDLAFPPSSTSNGNGKPKSIRRGRTPTAIIPTTASPSLPTSTSTALSPSIASDLDYLASTSDAADRNSRLTQNSSSALDDTDQELGSEEGEEEEEENLPPVKVIKIRRSSSRGAHSRPKLKNLMNGSGEGDEQDGYESVKMNYAELIPFGLVSPEEFEKKFVRVFKYGTLDILNPMHSDFSPLQSALFGTNQMKILKESTRQEKYEVFRTQVLLARRATRNLMPGVEEAVLRDLARI